MSEVDRPVLVTAGRFEYRWAELTETTGEDIHTDAVLVAAVPSTRPRVPPTAAEFQSPASVLHPSENVARAALWVDDAYPPGEWDLYVAIDDTPELPGLYAGTFTTA